MSAVSIFSRLWSPRREKPAPSPAETPVSSTPNPPSSSLSPEVTRPSGSMTPLFPLPKEASFPAPAKTSFTPSKTTFTSPVQSAQRVEPRPAAIMTRDRVWNKKRLNELKDRDWKRKEGWISQPASEEEKQERVDLAFKVWNHEAHQKKLRGEAYDDWNPDEWAQIGDKRKNTGIVKDPSPERKVGKTFEAPQDESDEEESAMVVTPTPSRVILEPRTVRRTSPSRRSPQKPLTDVDMTENALVKLPTSASPKRKGRTFELDYDKYDDEETFHSSDAMSVTPDAMKPVGMWTSDDFTDYLKQNYSFDPVQLATEVKNMEQGQMPSQLMQAFRAIQDIRAKATSELQHEIYQKRQDFEADLDEIRQKKLNEGLLLIKEFEDLQSKREAVRGYYNGETLAANVNGNQTPSTNKYNYPYVEASPPFTPENPSLAIAASNSSSNVENLIPTWDDIHREKPQPRLESSKQASVSWAQNTVYNHGLQGPNEPTLPDTPHPRPALKGSQLESFERKKSEATRYTPKQPSRLREVSDNEKLKAKASNSQAYQSTSNNIFEQSLKASKSPSTTPETSRPASANGKPSADSQSSRADHQSKTSSQTSSSSSSSTANTKAKASESPAKIATASPFSAANTNGSSSTKAKVNGISTKPDTTSKQPIDPNGKDTTAEIMTSLGPIFNHVYSDAHDLRYVPLSDQEKREQDKQIKANFSSKVGLWGTVDASPWTGTNDSPPFENPLWGSAYNKQSQPSLTN